MLALLLFVTGAVTVSSVVHLAARRSALAADRAAEADTLLTLARTVLGGDDSPQSVLDHLNRTLSVTAELRERSGGRWVRVAGSVDPTRGRSVIPVGADLQLVVSGDASRISGRILDGYAAQAAAALERQRLRVQAGQAEVLEAGNRMRTALLAAVSHDLRTPLASVKAAVSTLRQTDIAWTAEDQAALLATIEEGADRLDSLIGNLLDMTRIHTGAVQPFIRPTALDEVAPLAVGGLDGGRTGALRHPRRPAVAGHRPRLARTRAGQPDRQRAALLTRRPPAHADRRRPRRDSHRRGHRPWAGCPTPTSVSAIFEPFQRLGDQRHDDRCRPRPGRRQRLSRRRRGTLTAERHARRRTHYAHRPARRQPRPRPHRRRPVTSVLVIDDETALLRALRINLTARDYDVTTAADGATGLTAMARERPDVVILDLGLPDMDGTDVIRGIRGWSTTPIIVLSARGQEIQKVDALDAGADDYVTKPFGMNELLARLRAATRRSTPAVEEPLVTTGRLQHRSRRQTGHH